MFGFVAAVMERIPVVGLIFSISNRMSVLLLPHHLKTLRSFFSTFPLSQWRCNVGSRCVSSTLLTACRKLTPQNSSPFTDLEKQQHAYASGAIPRTKVYQSKTAVLPETGLPDEFVGGFPRTKGPVRIERDGSEVGLEGVSAHKKEL